MDPVPSAWRKARDLISSSDNLAVDVMIQAIPRYRPICALLNQFWSPLSTSTSISFRLNTSDSLLALETFSKEDIFIYCPFRPKRFLYPVTRHVNVYPQVHVYPQNVFVSFFSSSDMHQSHHLDGCQATGKSSPFIEAFWPFRFLQPLHHLKKLFSSSSRYSLSSYHIYNPSLVTNQSGTYCKEEESFHTALSHILSILKWSGTNFTCHGLTSTVPSHTIKDLKWSGTNFRVYGSSSAAFSHIFSVLKWSGNILSTKDFFERPFHTFSPSWSDHGDLSAAMGLFQRLFHMPPGP